MMNLFFDNVICIQIFNLYFAVKYFLNMYIFLSTVPFYAELNVLK